MNSKNYKQKRILNNNYSSEIKSLENFELIKKIVKLSKKSNLNLCHWKSNYRLPLSMEGISDFDFSIPQSDKKKLIVILKKMKFVEFFEPYWSRYEGVSDWIGVDFKKNIIYHIHLHTRLLTGAKFLKEQNLPWLEIMNKNLIRDKKTNILIPKPEFEYLLLIARESIKFYSIKSFIQKILGRKFIKKETINEYKWLWKKSKKKQIHYFGDQLFGSEDWSKIKKKVSFNFFKKKELSFKLLANDIFKSLKKYRSGSILSNSLKYILFYFWLKTSNIYENFFRNRSIGKRVKKKRAPLIAIIGPDGSGKTTLVSSLTKFYGEKIDLEKMYFGSIKYTFVKKMFGKKKSSKLAEYLFKHPQKQGIFFYILAIINAYLRLIKLKKSKKLNRKGITVISDRFPQNQFQSSLDGTSIKLIKGDFVNYFFYNIEKLISNKYKEFPPDLVIKINLKLPKLIANRPDDSIDKLIENSKVLKKVKFNNMKTINTQKNLHNIANRECWNILAEKNL